MSGLYYLLLGSFLFSLGIEELHANGWDMILNNPEQEKWLSEDGYPVAEDGGSKQTIDWSKRPDEEATSPDLDNYIKSKCEEQNDPKLKVWCAMLRSGGSSETRQKKWNSYDVCKDGCSGSERTNKGHFDCMRKCTNLVGKK